MSMTELSPSEVEQVFSNALQQHQSGNLDQAERLYSQVVAADPRHFDGFNLLGLIALQGDRNEKAADYFKRAIAISDKIADVHNNIGEAYRRLGHADLALAHFGKAADLDPSFVDARLNFGRVLLVTGRIDEAMAEFQKLVTADANNVQAKCCLADALMMKGQNEQAARMYQEAATLAPGFLPAQIAVARLRLSEGNSAEGLAAAMRALQADPGEEAKALFVQAIGESQTLPNHPDLRRFVTAALTEPWTRPYELVPAAVHLVKATSVVGNAIARITAPGQKQLDTASLFGPFGLTVLAKDELFRALLESAPVADADLEKLLTTLRFLLLIAASEPRPIDPDHLRFYCALARQCFINGYVFATTPVEDDMVARAKTALAGSIRNATAPYPLLVIAVAAYGPLHQVAGAEIFLNMAAPPPMTALFQQQIAEPQAEYELSVATPELTEINNDVSVAVRRQYEENPYPTWVRYPPAKPLPFDERMRLQFPAAPYRALGKPNPDILIAGCGTGQHSIDTARTHPEAHILAIDLSLASLGYAQRKTREAGVTNLEYGHADILRIGGIKRDFDIIESSGVLHHLNDPWEGWRVLLSLLRSNGVMRIGLYSLLARDHVRTARDFIAKGGYQPTLEGIRACRQMVTASKDELLRWIARSPDFYTTSACRDLMFHVQEHQLTLPEIKKFLGENGLTLLGLDALPARVFADYRKQFPGDTSMTDLDNWHTFETQHPHLFGGMYQFWVQKQH